MKVIANDKTVISEEVENEFETSVLLEELIEEVLSTDEYCVISELNANRGFKMTYYDSATGKLRRFYTRKSTGDVQKVISPVFKGEIHVIHRSEIESTVGEEKYKPLRNMDSDLVGL